jgi:hypothetical protein
MHPLVHKIKNSVALGAQESMHCCRYPLGRAVCGARHVDFTIAFGAAQWASIPTTAICVCITDPSCKKSPGTYLSVFAALA